MIILNMTNPIIVLLMLMVTVLLIFLAQEIKKSYIAAIALFGYLAILVIHVIQMVTLSGEYKILLSTLTNCIIIDFIFVLITFFAYLWVDDIEAKEKGKKSISNCLDWFWKKI